MTRPPHVLLLAFEDGARAALETRLARAGIAFEAVEPTWARVQAATAAREATAGEVARNSAGEGPPGSARPSAQGAGSKTGARAVGGAGGGAAKSGAAAGGAADGAAAGSDAAGGPGARADASGSAAARGSAGADSAARGAASGSGGARGAAGTKTASSAIPKVLVVDLSVRPSHARACVGHLLRRASWRGCAVVFARAPKEAAERAKALADAPGAHFAAGDEDLVRIVQRTLT